MIIIIRDYSRTLSDKTHWISAKPGYHNEIDKFLMEQTRVAEFEDCQK